MKNQDFKGKLRRNIEDIETVLKDKRVNKVRITFKEYYVRNFRNSLLKCRHSKVPNVGN